MIVASVVWLSIDFERLPQLGTYNYVCKNSFMVGKLSISYDVDSTNSLLSSLWIDIKPRSIIGKLIPAWVFRDQSRSTISKNDPLLPSQILAALIGCLQKVRKEYVGWVSLEKNRYGIKILLDNSEVSALFGKAREQSKFGYYQAEVIKASESQKLEDLNWSSTKGKTLIQIKWNANKKQIESLSHKAKGIGRVTFKLVEFIPI
jgi:hypothetical protein